jgi:hypothetical protein
VYGQYLLAWLLLHHCDCWTWSSPKRGRVRPLPFLLESRALYVVREMQKQELPWQAAFDGDFRSSQLLHD